MPSQDDPAHTTRDEHPHQHAIAVPSQPGEVRFNPKRAAWLWGMLLTWLIGAWWATTPGAIALFVVTSVITLCLGHSVGLHRGAIHRSYHTSKPLERALIYLATLAGMGGPLSMLKMHQLRDYWQCQLRAPEYYSYDHGPLQDFIWYLHCDHHPVEGEQVEVWLDPALTSDKFYQWLDRHWMAQQLPWAALCFVVGGAPWVIWGVCARVAVSLLGHWLVNYMAHNHGAHDWQIDGVGEQGRNNALFGALSMGEGWHNNHHAWPQSARLGHEPWQLDPGFMCIRVMARLKLVWSVKVAPTMENVKGARRTNGSDRVSI